MYKKAFNTRMDMETGKPQWTYSYPMFCQLFAEEFKDVRKAKHTGLSQCNICAAFKDESTQKLPPAEYEQKWKEYIDHIKLQSFLRMLYATRSEIARNPASSTWTIVINFASSQCKFIVSVYTDWPLQTPLGDCDHQKLTTTSTRSLKLWSAGLSTTHLVSMNCMLSRKITVTTLRLQLASCTII